MRIKIKVTKEILFQSRFCGFPGQDNISVNCAVALAIRELFPKATVGYNFITNDETKTVMSLPDKAKAFIGQFDISLPEERVEMKPFSFDIDVPNELLNQIGIGEAYKVLSESKTLELVHP